MSVIDHLARRDPDVGEARWLSRVSAGINLTLVAILLQGVTAGLFVNQSGREALVTVHGAVADLAWLAASGTAAFCASRLRRAHRRLTLTVVAWASLTLAQTGIGHLITDFGFDWLLAVHSSDRDGARR